MIYFYHIQIIVRNKKNTNPLIIFLFPGNCLYLSDHKLILS